MPGTDEFGGYSKHGFSGFKSISDALGIDLEAKVEDLRLELTAREEGRSCKAKVKTYQKFKGLVSSNKENFEPNHLHELDLALYSAKSRIQRDIQAQKRGSAEPRAEKISEDQRELQAEPAGHKEPEASTCKETAENDEAAEFAWLVEDEEVQEKKPAAEPVPESGKQLQCGESIGPTELDLAIDEIRKTYR